MWLAKKKLEILYRSSFDVERITTRISELVSKRTDLPFTVESLRNFNDLFEKRLEILSIIRKYPGSYDSLLNGADLPKEMNQELHVYLQGNKNGIKEYNFLRGIRKKNIQLRKLKDIDKYYDETLEKFKKFKEYYNLILKNLEMYKTISKEKKSRKLKQEKNRRDFSKESYEIEDLQRDLEEMGIVI
jgi:hypothetical protein